MRGTEGAMRRKGEAQITPGAENSRHRARKVQSAQGVEFDAARAHWMSFFVLNPHANSDLGCDD